MTKVMLDDSYDGSTLWHISDGDTEYYEVKCHGFKLQRFDEFEKAKEFLLRWAPEIEMELSQDDRRK